MPLLSPHAAPDERIAWTAGGAPHRAAASAKSIRILLMEWAGRDGLSGDRWACGYGSQSSHLLLDYEHATSSKKPSAAGMDACEIYAHKTGCCLDRCRRPLAANTGTPARGYRQLPHLRSPIFAHARRGELPSSPAEVTCAPLTEMGPAPRPGRDEAPRRWAPLLPPSFFSSSPWRQAQGALRVL